LDLEGNEINNINDLTSFENHENMKVISIKNTPLAKYTLKALYNLCSLDEISSGNMAILPNLPFFRGIVFRKFSKPQVVPLLNQQGH